MKRRIFLNKFNLSRGFWLRAWILIILGKKELHGYEIMSKLNFLYPDMCICKGPSHMGGGYRILRALEEEGLIESKWETKFGGPPKRIYKLTEEGEKLREKVIKDIERNIEFLNKILEFSKEEEV